MAGTLRESAPGEHGALRLVSARLTYQNTTVDVDQLAVGDYVINIAFEVVTPFNAGTTNTITVGDGTTADKYITAANIGETTAGVYPNTGNGPFAAITTASPIRITYAQAGTAATAGEGRCYALIASKPL